MKFPKRQERNGVCLQRVHEVEKAACEDVKEHMVVGLGAEEPTLLQTAKAPRKDVSN